MAAKLDVATSQLVGNAALAAKLDARDFVDEHCGLPTVEDILAELACSDGAAAAGRRALAAGAPILVDATMVAAGIMRQRLPAANRIVCTLDQPGVRDWAEAHGTTRSAAAVEHWRPELAGAVVAGHVIECGTQATGGNYSFFTEVPGMARVGFPWAAIAAVSYNHLTLPTTAPV